MVFDRTWAIQSLQTAPSLPANTRLVLAGKLGAVTVSESDRPHCVAFTYCEDEVPRGLGLGKEKYGGPFTMEQVEDVKTFYGILKVLFSFGIILICKLCS